MKTLCITALFLGLSMATFATKIIGTVTDTFETPLSNATVSVVQNSVVVSYAITDSNGKYLIENLSPDNYTFEVRCQFFEILSQSVNVSPESMILDFKLSVEETPEKEIHLVEIIDLEEEDCIELEPNVKNYSLCNFAYSRKSNCNYSLPVDTYQWEQNTEEYDYINENKFQKVMEQPLSTFSVDVDKAAYANVRRFINQGKNPPSDAVRIEELINYFHYDYDLPKGEHPFSANLEYGNCAWNKNHKLLMVGLKGKELENTQVPASNIVLLLDVSGSMSDYNKLPLVKKSFDILVKKLRPQDRLAIVVYAGNSGCVLESTPGNEKDKILAALNNLNAGGSTAGGKGIELAYKIAKQNFIKEGNNRVILATDGDFNVGASSNAEMVRLIQQKRDDGIFLSVLGFGMGNYKDSKMEQLSNAGNGNYAYIDNVLEAKKVFSEELWGTLFTIAKDVKIQIEFNPAYVKSYRLIGYENRLLENQDFNNDKKDAGEIGAGHTVTALYEIVPVGASADNKSGELKYQERKPIASNDLLTLKLRYKPIGENESVLIEKSIKERSVTSNNESDNFKLASSVAMFAMVLRNSEFKAQATLNKALKLAQQAKGKDENGYRAEYIQLIQKAEFN